MKILFDEAAIARETDRLARAAAALSPRVELMVPVLAGAFVFAADLLRALSRHGLDLPVAFMSLSRYGGARAGGAAFALRLDVGEAARGRHVLLVDGVLDRGDTLAEAGALLRQAGAASVATAVAVDKRRPDALLRADFAAFTGVDAFLVGYGMDDAGRGRGLPFIAATE